MTKPAAGRSPLLPAAILAFALVNVLWIGASFAVLAQGITDGSMRDRAHVVLGCAGAAVEALTVSGWLWALFASPRAGSPVNVAMQVMCVVTAAAQVATVLSKIALMGGWSWDEPAGFLLGDAAFAVLFAVLIARARKERTVNDAG